MIAIIHSTWDSDIVLDKGELEKLIQGEVLSGEIADYPKLGEVNLSRWDKDNSGFYFNLEWDKSNPRKYHFRINSLGIEMLKDKNYVHGRYDNGLNGSKLAIYGPGKDELTKDNIEFSIQMIKVTSKK